MPAYNFIDIPIGTRFGHLVVQKLSDKKNSSNKRLWECVCDCGKTTYATGSDLRNGKRKTCGCRGWNPKKLDLTGQRFGKWTVIEEIKDATCKQIKWKCKCDCGNYGEVITENLRSGKSQSCGCKNREDLFNARWKDLSGQRFGKLTAISYIRGTKENPGSWLCKCDCGNHTYVKPYALMSGNTQSCGCVLSRGEQKITALLTQYGIPFVTQKKFDTCIFPDTNAPARFDFFVNNEYLIEYDGQQHFKVYGWTTEEALKRTQWRDQIKNEWCRQNNIPLIRIPYTHFDNLNIHDLILEESEFVWQPEEAISPNSQQ